MSDDKYAIELENPTDEAQSTELMSRQKQSSKLTSRYEVTVPQQSTYFSQTIIQITTSDNTYTTTLEADTSASDLADVMTAFGIGTFILESSDAGGNVYSVKSDQVVKLLEIDDSSAAFNIGSGFDNEVLISQIQSNDKILIGGLFNNYNGTTSNEIIRLSSDGSIDNTFDIGSGFNSIVEYLIIQSDDKVLVGGWFTSYDGSGSDRIIRLNTDGSIDGTFNVGSGFNNRVITMVQQSDDKILVGGQFTSYNGSGSNRIIRLNADGSIDGTFSIGTGFNSTVMAISIQSDGKILVGGFFFSYNGSSSNRIIRLNDDGSVDGTFNVGTGFNIDLVYHIAIQSDGKIIAAGDFTSYNGSSSNRIIRLNDDGSVDGTFNIGSGFNNEVFSVTIQSDGKIIAVGDFTSYNGSSFNRIIRLNTDGSIDNTFNIGTGFNDSVQDAKVQSNDKIIVVGDFTSYKGNSRKRIVRLNEDGSNNTVAA